MYQNFSEVQIYIISALSLYSNALLIFLIVKKSPSYLGNYKYLMLIFSIFGISFGFINVTCQPKLHFYKASYIIFSENPLGLPRKLNFWYLALNCSTYGMTLFLLAFHFVYRYLAVIKPQRLYYFSFPYFSILIGVFFFVTLDWWFSAVYFAGENDQVEEYIRENMLQTFNLSLSDYTYAVSIFYRKDPKTGVEQASFPDFLFLANLDGNITTGFFIIGFCWLKLQRVFLQKSHSFANFQSRRTMEMQHQLFRVLVFQTIFPIFLLFFPAGCLLGFPVLKIEPGPVESIILSLMATQPVMDSLVPMYFIRDYRNAIRRVFVKVTVPELSVTTPGNRVFPI